MSVKGEGIIDRSGGGESRIGDRNVNEWRRMKVRVRRKQEEDKRGEKGEERGEKMRVDEKIGQT